MPTSSAKTATRADDRASPPWSTVSHDLMKTLRYACARSAEPFMDLKKRRQNASNRSARSTGSRDRRFAARRWICFA